MKLIPLRLLAFFFRNAGGKVVLAVILGIVAGASSVALMVLINGRLSQQTTLPQKFVWFFAGLLLIDFVANYVSGLLSVRIAQDTSFDMRMRMSRHVITAPLRRLEEAGSHRILATLTQDVPNINTAFLRLPQLCINGAILLGCLIYLGWLSPLMLLTLSFFLGLAVLSWLVLGQRAKNSLREARTEWDHLVNHFRAMTDGAKEMKLHRGRRDAFFNEVLHGTTTAYKRHNVAAGNIYAFLTSWSHVLYFIVIGLILFVLPMLPGSVSMQALTGYALTVLYIRGPLAILLGIFPSFSAAHVSLQRIEELGLSLESPARRDEEGKLQVEQQGWQTLELSGVTHHYYLEEADDSFTLGPIDLTLSPGELVFIIGGNGSGKTTLAKILTGLYAPESGAVLLDGVAVTDEKLDDYRQLFSAVFSDFYLFQQLLGLVDTQSDARARSYLKKLHLDHKVKVEDGKLSTTELSYGQRKRLALLTAYLEDRPIYLFDEWSAGQDPYFKEIFYFQILPELKSRGKTVVVISHDDQYYQVADRLIKLDYGRVSFDKAMGYNLANQPAGNFPSNMFP